MAVCGQCYAWKDKYEAYRRGLEDLDKRDHKAKQRLTMANFVGGIHNGKRMSEAQVELLLCNGKHSADLSRERDAGCCVHHAVLDNNPLVDGYLSPMWDGGELRYESPDVYEMLSR